MIEKEGVAERSGDDAPIKRRNLDEGEATAKRVSDDTEEMATVLTSMDAAGWKEAYIHEVLGHHGLEYGLTRTNLVKLSNQFIPPILKHPTVHARQQIFSPDNKTTFPAALSFRKQSNLITSPSHTYPNNKMQKKGYVNGNSSCNSDLYVFLSISIVQLCVYACVCVSGFALEFCFYDAVKKKALEKGQLLGFEPTVFPLTYMYSYH
uniref:Uncharacterized protein n=1 Tax=Tanacetum cinerariifolium TaxID=118510 RepID=A0A6L2N3V2_TANCI|nr:hypothetical protein [Tanacetum cinerariifolium]